MVDRVGHGARAYSFSEQQSATAEMFFDFVNATRFMHTYSSIEIVAVGKKTVQ